MNNFQLNNTSVYLGGQCKWDILVGNYNGQLYIQGFQLTPLSNNIPFNKRGSVDHLNDDHSYTIKKYCQDMKENFWSINPCLNEKVTKVEGNVEIDRGYTDNSFLAGLKRTSCYQVYHKQFECLQPVWLESIGWNQNLEFSFNLYSIVDNNIGRILDKRNLTLAPIDSDLKIYEFHNKFVKYFYDWLRALNIKAKEQDSTDYGNNKVLNIDLQGGTASIDGVSIVSGQKTNPISCDYVCSNLLTYERPNIETDYILTSLFQTHNTIVSQLFNFNFCFNLADVVNPFFINQLNGKYFSIGCDSGIKTKISDDEFTKDILERRSLFTNYTFIQKDVYNPYIFINNMDLLSTGGLERKYDVKYIYHGDEIRKESDLNVLDYLRDYNNPDIKDTNKITQHIVHWDYIDHKQDIFNLYDGYSGVNSFDDKSNSIEIDPDIPTPVTWDIELFDLDKINRLDVVYTDNDPNKNNGAFNWINPTKMLYMSGNIVNDLYNKIIYPAGDPDCILYHEGLWNISKSFIGEFKYSNLSPTEQEGLSKFYLSFIYIPDHWGETNPAQVFAGWNRIDTETTNKVIVVNNPHNTTLTGGEEYSHYLIVSNDVKFFSIKNILSISLTTAPDKADIKNIFSDNIGLINQIIKNLGNDYNFYGFNTEIEIGKDDLENECYYKSLSRKTFLYRKCGKLVPCLKTDDSFDINYLFYQSSYNNNIYQIIPGETEYELEYKTAGFSKMISVMNEIEYKGLEKQTSHTEVTLKSLIKQQLGITYNIQDNPEMIDYIYNLYNITFKYEYKSETKIDTVVYNVKMILK